MSKQVPSYVWDKQFKVWGKEDKNRNSLGDDLIEEDEEEGSQGVVLSNPHLQSLETDCLYHIGLTRHGDNLKKQFGDVRFVLTGGSSSRLHKMAKMLARTWNQDPNKLIDLAASAHRFSMYKVGPVICVNHGMGIPSLTICLHEIFKLLYYAECKNVIIMRLGTCGGIGQSPGTVVISSTAVNERFTEDFKQVIMGKEFVYDVKVDQQLVNQVMNLANERFPEYKVIKGKTFTANDFYVGQGRLDGALCGYSAEDRETFLLCLKKHKVVNIEMESNAFFALCHHVKLKAINVNVVLVDRDESDQVKFTPEDHAKLQQRPLEIALEFILHKLRRPSFVVPN